MKITVRGWRRDMGKTEIIDHDLLYVEYSDDGTVWRDTPALYHHLGGMKIAWYQPLRLTGNYRMDVHFSGSDIMRLFKCFFGSEIQQELVERYGLTFSPEVVKSMLKTIKLTDLTLGELVAMNSTESQPAAPKPVDEKHVEPGENVTRLIRRA